MAIADLPTYLGVLMVPDGGEITSSDGRELSVELTTSEWIALSASVVSALGALGALIFAYLTIREAARMRSEEREDRQRSRLERAADIAKHMGEISFMGGNFHLAALRLAVAINATGLDLPKCRTLVHVKDSKQATQPAADALGEVANRLADISPSPGVAVRAT